MQQLVFLGSTLPLTKTFSVEPSGAILSAPYPQVSKVTSYHEPVKNLTDMLKHIQHHAKAGHCLYGGQLQRPLQHESRAGLADKQPRDWIVFDFDKVDGKSPEDVVKRYLPAACQNVSFIAQLSPSMFKPGTDKWSGHIFMLLKTPTDELDIKQWFEYINFSTPALEKQFRLSDSEHALHWPLDRVVAYTARIIYIAPPKCHGFEPAVTDPNKLVTRKQTHLVIPKFTPVTHEQIRGKINELRAAIGLDPLVYELTNLGGEDVLKNASVCEVHGIRTSGDHFLRFNLNGGDSYAYFIDLRNPSLVRNFKGEPSLRTEDVAPELYKSLRKHAPRVVAKQPLDEGTEVLAFYATNQGSPVKIGTFNPGQRKLTLHTASETSAKSWQLEYGLPPRPLLPHMDIVFNPKLDTQYVPGSTLINSFRATDFMVKERGSMPSNTREIPATIDKTMRSMLGDPTTEVYEHFLNWLAFIFQYREKSQTAWVISGTTGTGKGVFVRNILTPLFGTEHVKTVQFGLVMTNFNAYLDNALFVIFEEADVAAVSNPAELTAKLNHYITDSPIEINQKNARTYAADNYSNFLLFTNTKAAATIRSDNRRINIAERQEKSIFYTPNELRSILAGDDLDAFADVLQRWPVNMLNVRKLVKTQAAVDMHESSTTINQLVAEAIMAGDLQFFIDRTPSAVEAEGDFGNRANPSLIYKDVLDRSIAAARHKRPMVLTDPDIYVLFRMMIPDPRYFQDSKTWRMRHYKALGLDVSKQHRLPGDSNTRVRGLEVKWQIPSDMPQATTPRKPESVVTPIKRKKG